jgi:hypothetical protein
LAIFLKVKRQKSADKVCIWRLLFATNFQDDKEARTTAKIQEKQQE